MRFGVVIGMVGSLVGSAAVAGASYYSWEIFQAGSLEKRLDGFNKLKDALDFELTHKREVGEAFAPGFTLEDVEIVADDKRIAVEKIEFRKFDWKTPHQPRFAHVVLTGMKFKIDVFAPILGPDMAKVLEEAKIESVVVDASFEHESGEEIAEDPKTKQKVKRKTVSIKELKLSFRDLGSFTATVELKDFDVKPKAVAKQAREMPPLVRMLGEQVQYASMRVVFEDKALMKAIIDAKSKEIGKGELQARGVFVRELQKDATTTRGAVGSNRFDKDYFEPMIAYIGGGYANRTGFTLTSTPAQPIEIRRLVVMWDANRGGFFDKFNPKIALGPQRPAAPKKEDPKKKEEPKKKDEAKKPDKPAPGR